MYKKIHKSEKRINVWMRILLLIRSLVGRQITVARSGALKYVILTREHGKFSKWEKREELSGKNAQQAVKSAIARYPGYLLYFPKRVLKKALASKQR